MTTLTEGRVDQIQQALAEAGLGWLVNKHDLRTAIVDADATMEANGATLNAGLPAVIRTGPKAASIGLRALIYAAVAAGRAHQEGVPMGSIRRIFEQ